MKINFLKNEVMSDYTTIGLGGKAKLFLKCTSLSEITDALKYSEENNLKVQVISGGSNIIFPDNGYDGIVMKIDLKGIEFSEVDNLIYAKVEAGENWDDFVKIAIEKSLSGIECLSGIPGSAGATPVQNVGAYGQEVGETIHSVEAIERSSLELVSFTNSECKFNYRSSRFKSFDKDKYIITSVTFAFQKNKPPEIKYAELQKFFNSDSLNSKNENLKIILTKIRNAVLALRKSKSMLIDEKDPDSKSCGSFFLNPVLDKNEFEKFKKITEKNFQTVPVFQSGDKYKIPAAWLVENAGFYKGYKKGGVGISKKHSLALINISGNTDELVRFACEIEDKVFNRFGIKLFKEPVEV